MMRALWFLTLVTSATVLIAWLIERPGTVLLQWQGYRIETSVALLIAIVAVIAALAAFIYQIFITIRRAPAQVSAMLHGHRQKKGYRALTRGMVAIAAGDANEARRQEKRAQVLLQDPPLTMLFSAQTAQLNGDEKAAERFFQAMSEQPDTEFLGIRGLLNQALSRGDNPCALDLALRAYQLRPTSEWVAAQLFDLQIHQGLWLDAQITNDEQVQALLVNKATGQRRKALLALQRGAEMSAAGDLEAAAKTFKIAYNQSPTFIPAVLAHAGTLIKQGKLIKATEIIKKAWRTQPHPELLFPFWLGSDAQDGLSILKATERLVLNNSDHPESSIALARAALEAQLWGEARKHLKAVTPHTNTHVEARVCRLWAELEESENQNAAASRGWLKQASIASGDPTWVCGSCGNAVNQWSVLCGNCGLFDTLTWAPPRHVLSHAPSEETPALTLTKTEG